MRGNETNLSLKKYERKRGKSRFVYSTDEVMHKIIVNYRIFMLSDYLFLDIQSNFFAHNFLDEDIDYQVISDGTIIKDFENPNLDDYNSFSQMATLYFDQEINNQSIEELVFSSSCNFDINDYNNNQFYLKSCYDNYPGLLYYSGGNFYFFKDDLSPLDDEDIELAMQTWDLVVFDYLNNLDLITIPNYEGISLNDEGNILKIVSRGITYSKDILPKSLIRIIPQ